MTGTGRRSSGTRAAARRGAERRCAHRPAASGRAARTSRARPPRAPGGSRRSRRRSRRAAAARAGPGRSDSRAGRPTRGRGRERASRPRTGRGAARSSSTRGPGGKRGAEHVRVLVEHAPASRRRSASGSPSSRRPRAGRRPRGPRCCWSGWSWMRAVDEHRDPLLAVEEVGAALRVGDQLLRARSAAGVAASISSSRNLRSRSESARCSRVSKLVVRRTRLSTLALHRAAGEREQRVLDLHAGRAGGGRAGCRS